MRGVRYIVTEVYCPPASSYCELAQCLLRVIFHSKWHNWKLFITLHCKLHLRTPHCILNTEHCRMMLALYSQIHNTALHSSILQSSLKTALLHNALLSRGSNTILQSHVQFTTLTTDYSTFLG